jgi:hypothetical protein
MVLLAPTQCDCLLYDAFSPARHAAAFFKHGRYRRDVRRVVIVIRSGGSTLRLFLLPLNAKHSEIDVGSIDVNCVADEIELELRRFLCEFFPAPCDEPALALPVAAHLCVCV